jgi:hypothetical protein
MDELGGDGAREGDAHRREPVGDEDGVRLVGLVQPGDPDLVRPDVAHDDVLRAERTPEVVDGPLGLDRVAGVAHAGLEVAEERRAQIGVDEGLA